ncbi:MAG: hypothetical protein JW967_06225 [Dehalococcoidales bacterium]|nr:hypothetical protein [Dehalococcoidales bacterium]
MKELGLHENAWLIPGRKMQNTGVLVKEALMEAEDSGTRVEFIRAIGNT